MAINLKLFCTQTQKHEATIVAMCLKTQFVLQPKYQREAQEF